MSVRFNTRVVIDAARYESRMKPRYQEAQKYLDNEVLKDCDRYVPMRTGNLRNSGIRGTTIGSGEVKYNASYARKMYYGRNFHFSKVKHPEACAFWFEKAKGVNLKKWLDGVSKILGGRSLG